MTILKTHIDTATDQYQRNADSMQALVNVLDCCLQKNSEGGSQALRKLQIDRGKLLARQRIEALLDVGSFFLELSPLAGYQLYQEPLPAAGLITGIGRIHGRAVMLFVNDATVKGGTYYPVTVKKHLRAQEIAAENHLPCVYLVDSGGAFLHLQDEVFPDKENFGRIFYQQARLSAAGIPQLAVVMGPCIAGGAYLAAMSNETVIVKKQGTIYLGGPELVRAATGEQIDAESLGGGEMHCRISGVADHLADNDCHALDICRDIFLHLSLRKMAEKLSFDEPLYPASQLYGIVPADIRQSVDAHEIIARLVDGSEFHEFKALYGVTLVCGFAHIEGFPVGIIANNGILFSEAALKATHFIQLCNQRNMPLVFLQNIAGFMVGKDYEQRGIAKDGAKMVTAVATATVAKFTVIVGGSFGAGNYAMCGRAYGPRQLWMWPNARISVMGGDVAASLLSQIREQKQSDDNRWTDDEKQEYQQGIKSRYEEQGSPYYSTARLWDDGVINPVSTRRYLAEGLALAAASADDNTRWSPIYRM